MKRDAGLDLVKWLALLTMLVDHLRHLWPQAQDELFILGRLAFPLFCLGIAANVRRSRSGELFTPNNARYLAWLVAFSVISELPYQWLSTQSSSLNIMPTLTLGLLVAWAVHHQSQSASLLGAAGIAAGALLHDVLMYGVFGVLLPASLVIALKRSGVFWLLPAVVSVLANSRNRWSDGLSFDTIGNSVVVEFMAPLLGLWLLRAGFTWRVWPVGRWGYFFYPIHLLLLTMIRAVL